MKHVILLGTPLVAALLVGCGSKEAEPPKEVKKEKVVKQVEKEEVKAKPEPVKKLSLLEQEIEELNSKRYIRYEDIDIHLNRFNEELRVEQQAIDSRLEKSNVKIEGQLRHNIENVGQFEQQTDLLLALLRSKKNKEKQIMDTEKAIRDANKKKKEALKVIVGSMKNHGPSKVYSTMVSYPMNISKKDALKKAKERIIEQAKKDLSLKVSESILRVTSRNGKTMLDIDITEVANDIIDYEAVVTIDGFFFNDGRDGGDQDNKARYIEKIKEAFIYPGREPNIDIPNAGEQLQTLTLIAKTDFKTDDSIIEKILKQQESEDGAVQGRGMTSPDNLNDSLELVSELTENRHNLRYENPKNFSKVENKIIEASNKTRDFENQLKKARGKYSKLQSTTLDKLRSLTYQREQQEKEHLHIMNKIASQEELIASTIIQVVGSYNATQDLLGITDDKAEKVVQIFFEEELNPNKSAKDQVADYIKKAKAEIKKRTKRIASYEATKIKNFSTIKTKQEEEYDPVLELKDTDFRLRTTRNFDNKLYLGAVIKATYTIKRFVPENNIPTYDSEASCLKKIHNKTKSEYSEYKLGDITQKLQTQNNLNVAAN